MPIASDSKLETFRRLHERGCFVIPNPWDAGSARYLQTLGFSALATTSSGFAWSGARADNNVTLDAALGYLRTIVNAVEIPVNADFESGFADDEANLARNIVLAAETGVTGISLEDSTGDLANPLIDFDTAVARMRAARLALDRVAPKVMLIGRSEGFIVGRPDLAETRRRLVTYAEAGADCLYAPGLRTPEEITSIVNAVAPKPVNVLVGSDFMNVDAIAALGVRRISVGGALARAAWGEFMRAASEIANQKTFHSLARAATFADVNGLFKSN